MTAGENGEALGRAIEIHEQRVDDSAKFKDERGVDHVLAGRAPVHETRCGLVALGDLGGQRMHERDRDVAGFGGGVRVSILAIFAERFVEGGLAAGISSTAFFAAATSCEYVNGP